MLQRCFYEFLLLALKKGDCPDETKTSMDVNERRDRLFEDINFQFHVVKTKIENIITVNKCCISTIKISIIILYPSI